MRKQLFSALLPPFLILCGAGMIAGITIQSFFLAILSSVLMNWIAYFLSLRSPILFASLDPENPQREVLISALQKGIDHTQQSKVPLLVRLSTPAGPKQVSFLLQMDRKGSLFLQQSGMRKVRLPFQNQWIADHALPFHFSGEKATVLRMDPTQSEKVRVSQFKCHTPSPLFSTLLFLIMFSSCMMGIEWISAISCGIGMQSALMHYGSKCAP